MVSIFDIECYDYLTKIAADVQLIRLFGVFLVSTISRTSSKHIFQAKNCVFPIFIFEIFTLVLLMSFDWSQNEWLWNKKRWFEVAIKSMMKWSTNYWFRASVWHLCSLNSSLFLIISVWEMKWMIAKTHESLLIYIWFNRFKKR